MKTFKQYLIENNIIGRQIRDYHTHEMNPDMSDPVHMAASAIHDAWMERNPKADDNAAQHVPYHALPQEEQEKDIAHLRTISGLHSSIPVPTVHPITGERLTTEEDRQAAHSHLVADAFGKLAHENWRKGFEAKHGKGTKKPKDVVNVNGEIEEININVPWEELHPQWKDENYQAGLAAHDAFRVHLVGSAQY